VTGLGTYTMYIGIITNQLTSYCAGGPGSVSVMCMSCHTLFPTTVYYRMITKEFL
jgi:hypothetical protein